MDKPVEVNRGIAVVRMGLDNSVDARNFLAQIGHLIEYASPKSEEIVFRIDSDSLHQAAEWGVDLWTILRKLRELSESLPRNESQRFYNRIYRPLSWSRNLKVQEKGEYCSWLTRRDSHLRKIFWTKLRIIQSFWLLKGFERSVAYLDLPKSVQKAIEKRKESWSDLIEFAGLDSRAEMNGREQEHKPLLSLEGAISEIIRRKSVGKPLGVKAVRLDDWRLYRSGVAHFRGWFEAVEAAGVILDSEPHEKVWTRADIVAEVQDIKDRGEPINSRYIDLHYPRLRSASRYHFESWDAVLTEAGYDPNEERLKKSWRKRNDLLVELRRLKGAGLPINPAALRKNRNIYQSLCSYYDSWEEAVEAAGFDPKEEKYRRS